MRCLLVDDEPGIREGLAALLRRKGHEVRTAGDCAAAAAALEQQHVDIVITDWRLPDGTASRFVAGCACPVVAISGHPEEVDALPALCATLTKPVSPSRLLEVLAVSVPPAPPAAEDRLPIDVQQLVEEVGTHLPAGAVVELLDEGPFVLLRAEPVHEGALPALEALGGDLRVLASAGRTRLELRLCRDGRPDVDVAVVRPDAVWPDTEVFAVDFHDTTISAALFVDCLDRAASCRANGRRVHFLNVPDRLRSAATDQGRAHDMPMKDKVGPRLPAVFADLWSQL
ncbi:MAG TPA: response regulator [Planctomycetota bacterium]|nr:response regulator [Planctomycetota bacterium]